jgi:hypothetical protein
MDFTIFPNLVAAVQSGNPETIKGAILKSGLAGAVTHREFIPKIGGQEFCSQKIGEVRVSQQYAAGTLFFRVTENKEYGNDIVIAIYPDNTAEFQFGRIPF